MYDELVRRLRDSEHEIDCSLCDRDCCYPDGKVHDKCIIIEAADAIEAQDRHILTLQHEMMAEAESHIAEVNRLNKQIEELERRLPKAPHGRLIDADNIGLTNFEIILCQKGNPYRNALEMIFEKIENAPTVIPAEEGE